MSERIGFYSLVPTIDKKGCLGAMLVTDDLGKPEEFRVTYPVKPTRLQEQLYGNSLLPHIGVELCGKPLFDALDKKPSCLLVSEIKLLRLGDIVSCDVCHVVRMGDTLRITSQAEDTAQQHRNRLDSASGKFAPLTSAFPQSYDEARKNIAWQRLMSLFSGIDLLEPFERIQVAIDVLAEQDQRFR